MRLPWGHGHGRDGVANVFRDAVLEVELLVFEAAEQAPELVDCESPGDVAEPGDGGHSVERLSNLSRPSPALSRSPLPMKSSTRRRRIVHQSASDSVTPDPRERMDSRLRGNDEGGRAVRVRQDAPLPGPRPAFGSGDAGSGCLPSMPRRSWRCWRRRASARSAAARPQGFRAVRGIGIIAEARGPRVEGRRRAFREARGDWATEAVCPRPSVEGRRRAFREARRSPPTRPRDA